MKSSIKSGRRSYHPIAPDHGCFDRFPGRERTGTADAAHVVEGESSKAETVVFEVEGNRVLAGRLRYGMYLLKGKPVFTWNLLGLNRVRWESPQALSEAAVGRDS